MRLPVRAMKEAPVRTGEQALNPYVFVVGCPRSGTTLLQRMLDHHPQLALAPEAHFVTRVIETLPVGIDPPLTPQLIEQVRGHRRFHILGLSEDAVQSAAANADTYAEFVSALFSAYGESRGKRLAGEKTPHYVNHLPRLHTLFPWSKFIHIVRDGRDVALSALDWDRGPVNSPLWQEEPVAVCALWWRDHVGAGREAGRELGPAQYYEMSYEALVEEPEASLRGAAAFLELPFAQEMVDFHVGKTRTKPSLSAKKAWLPPTTGLRDWRSQFAGRDLELFEALAGDLLSEAGYERAAECISPDVGAVAERCEQWWENKGNRVIDINAEEAARALDR